MFGQEVIDNPYPFYASLRKQGRMLWCRDFPGGAWLITRHAQVVAALRDPRLSVQRSDRFVGQFPPAQQAEFRAFNRAFSRWMLFLDPPRHTQLRKLMNRGFRPDALAAFRPQVEQIVHALIDRIEAQGCTDFMRDFAHPLPALVVARMLGIEAGDQDRFLKWSDDIAAFFGNPASPLAVARAAQESLVALTEYFRSLLAQRRRHPGPDLISLLIRAEDEGAVLDEEDLLAQCTVLLFAGHETTRNLLGNGMLALLQHPAQWDAMRRDRCLLPGAVRELLRYDSPVQCTARRAAHDFVLDGCHVQAGDTVIALIGSANHDPEVFSAPDTLDITRKQGPHLAFGLGAHVCIGAALTHLQAEIAFNAWMERMPRLRMADQHPQWGGNFAFRGLKSLALLPERAAACPT